MREQSTLDPVTFEVLKNSFTTIVDEMAEQILRTCHSFVIWSRDFSNALCDAEGNTVMQGSQDIAVHVGTLHFTAKAIIEAFEGEINPGDVYAINDPYQGGTHFPDVRIVRPIFVEDELIAFAQSNGHWQDIGGNVPGSFDVGASMHFGEGLRIPAVKIYDRDGYRHDVVNLMISNTRAPEIAEGDLTAQVEATRVAERELVRLVERYGKDTVVTAFAEVQDYVEELTRQKVSELPDGIWETEDYIDQDPSAEEGLIPIKVKMTIDGDEVYYDLSGSHPVIGSFLNATHGSAFSGIVAGMKTFFPEIPLNSGFYRLIEPYFPENTVVNAPWPTAVTGFCSGSYEKIINSVFELWSQVMPEKALACCFNLEYLLIGGWDKRAESPAFFMWYDWSVGGWGARNGRDGADATSPVFGVGLAAQPFEGQERLTPVVTSAHQMVPDSGGPGTFRGGCGVEKGGTLTEIEETVMSYCCDRARSITWGMEGGLPSYPHGVWLDKTRLHEVGGSGGKFLGATFSDVEVREGERFVRPSAGGGGYGDPLLRDLEAVCEDVADGYVTPEGAKRDYGVVVREVDAVLAEWEVDEEATEEEREHVRENRVGWLEADPEEVAERYRDGEIGTLDAIRRYGVILDWGTGELLPKTTDDFRAMLKRRAVPYWENGSAEG
jgi:N-methylhydantoinase B